MKKLLLALILSAVSSSAMAKWFEVTSVPDEGTVYADPATVRVSGNKVKIWMLVDYNKAMGVDGGKYLSMMTQQEYDCKEEQGRKQGRTMAATTYHRNMGRGTPVIPKKAPYQDSYPIVPGSLDEILWKFVCGK